MHKYSTILSQSIGNCPTELELIDHRKSNNPYQSKFGDVWEHHIRKSPILHNTTPVSDLIIHMAKCTTEAMKGSVFEGKGLFYHDALSQLTEKETIAWMKLHKYEGRTYHSMWITPVLGCNDTVENKDGKILKYYAHSPVGNMPELMRLDNSLNQDVHANVAINVSATSFLPESDPRKFSLSTPKKILSAYKRVYCPTMDCSSVLSSNRIVQDLNKVIFALKCIVQADGHVLHGLASRTGHHRWVEHCNSTKDTRTKSKSNTNNKRTGKQKRQDDENSDGFCSSSKDSDYGLHHDAKCALQDYWGKTDGKIE